MLRLCQTPAYGYHSKPTRDKCYHPIWVLAIAVVLFLCAIIYGMTLADYLELFTAELFAGFDSLIITVVAVRIVLAYFTAAKYGNYSIAIMPPHILWGGFCYQISRPFLNMPH